MSEAGGEEEDDAAQAFEALRAEVARLRQGIELVYRQGQEAKSAAGSGAAGPGVDYSLTLGQMQKALQAVQGRLETIEGKPALAMTPEVYRDRIEEMGRVAGQVAGRAMSEGAAAQSQATRELKDMLGRKRSTREQRERMGFRGRGRRCDGGHAALDASGRKSALGHGHLARRGANRGRQMGCRSGAAARGQSRLV